MEKIKTICNNDKLVFSKPKGYKNINTSAGKMEKRIKTKMGNYM